MIFSRIDFIKSTNILTGTVEYSTDQIYNADLSAEETSSSFDAFFSVPRSFKFTLNLGDPFFDDFMRVQNTVNEFSSYFIRVYDEDSNHVYSGLMKRTDYSVDEEEETIDITAKDFGILLSIIKNQSVTVSDVINLGLDDRENMYNYYILIFLYRIGNESPSQISFQT